MLISTIHRPMDSLANVLTPSRHIILGIVRHSETVMRLALLFIGLVVANFSSHAQWYEAQGHAYISGSESKAARKTAIENALKRALLVAGASVSSVQQTVNGLLTQDEISIRATGSVNSFEIVDEIYSDDLVTVTIRADIFPQGRQCFSADYKKSLLLTQSYLINREQANIGQIYGLDKQVIKKLAHKLNEEGMYLDTKLSLKNMSAFSRYNQSLDMPSVKHLAMTLSSLTDTQYVLFSEITDVSFGDEANNNWQFWQEDEFDRQFAFSVYIYNGNNGELMFEKQYHNSAPWTYTKRKKVDVTGKAFWQSAYGNGINQTLEQLIADIDDNMMCQPTRGRILNVSGSEILINLGSRHGVKVGDEFSLLHTKNFITEKGKVYAGFNVSEYKVTVSQVTKESARAQTTEQELLDNIQLNDLAVRY